MINSRLDAATAAVYRDLATWIAALAGQRPCPIIGITGAQGSGKSTAAAFLARELAAVHRLRAAVLSLDDFYLPRTARLQRAADDHPLFATRGVPGTHEVALGVSTLRALQRGESPAVPQFSKADDDRVPESQWPVLAGPVDLILFEGWCVGLPPQSPAALIAPINALEASEDADVRWRTRVNDHLATDYADWFALLDARVFLRVPDLDCVRRWRGQQEQDTARAANRAARGLQGPAQLERFIQHYARLTLHALDVLPQQADVLLSVGPDHAVRELLHRQH